MFYVVRDNQSNRNMKWSERSRSLTNRLSVFWQRLEALADCMELCRVNGNGVRSEGLKGDTVSDSKRSLEEDRMWLCQIKRISQKDKHAVILIIGLNPVRIDHWCMLHAYTLSWMSVNLVVMDSWANCHTGYLGVIPFRHDHSGACLHPLL